MINLFKKKIGFSIIEILVVIFIISLGLVGVVSLVIQNVQVQYINKNFLIASQLAQEGLELVRNVRDANWLNPANPWAFSTIALEGDSLNYIIYRDDSVDIVLGADPINNSSAKLKIINDYYDHGMGNDSGFSRIIETTNDNTASSTLVSSIVQWTDRVGTHQYVVDTYLYDWR